MSPEFSPIGTLVSGKIPLEFDYHQDQELAQELRYTATALEETIPYVTPNQTEVNLTNAPILDEAGQRRRGNTISLAYSEADSNHSATIKIQEATKGVATLQLSPLNPDEWDIRHPGSDRTIDIFSTSDLVGYLSARLPEPAAYREMLNNAEHGDHLNAMEVVHLLASYIKDSSRTVNQSVHYKAVDDQRSVELVKQETRAKVTHGLGVSAMSVIGHASILKHYSYSSVMPHGHHATGTGIVQLSSKSGIPQNKLQEWAERDQEDRYPLETLYDALLALRRHYNI